MSTSNLFSAGKAARDYMRKNGLRGTESEIMKILQDKGVSISEMKDKAFSFMENPLVKIAAKAVGAPMEEIRRTLNALSGGNNSSSGASKTGGRLERL